MLIGRAEVQGSRTYGVEDVEQLEVLAKALDHFCDLLLIVDVGEGLPFL